MANTQHQPHKGDAGVCVFVTTAKFWGELCPQYPTRF